MLSHILFIDADFYILTTWTTFIKAFGPKTLINLHSKRLMHLLHVSGPHVMERINTWIVEKSANLLLITS